MMTENMGKHLTQYRIRVAALTTGKRDPSARFRIRQHIDALKNLGIDVNEHWPIIDKHAGLPSVISDHIPRFTRNYFDAGWFLAKMSARLPGLFSTYTSDLVWLNRELVMGRYTLERFITRPFILDIDDAVWLAKPHGLATIDTLGRKAIAVIAGNDYLANWFAGKSNNIHVVPTAIDIDRFQPDINHVRTDNKFTIGWTGTSGNLKYLYAIEPAIKRILEEFDARMLVIAEEPPKFNDIDPRYLSYKEWSPLSESVALRDIDLGLMPLPDNDWTRGKCSFKMLQYMSTGIPVVVSPVGMNIQVLARGNSGLSAESVADWYEAMKSLISNRQRCAAMGQIGRQIILEHYSNKVISTQLANIIHGLKL